MARRRYISTAISCDAAVSELAEDYGEFAALLYTWMIPHAEDNGSINADISSLILMVIPGIRSRTKKDVEKALLGMVEKSLIAWDRDRNIIQFPESFYIYQTYIAEKRRTIAEEKAKNTQEIKSKKHSGTNEQDENSAKQRKTAQCAESSANNIIAPESAQNTALLRFSSSFLSSVSSSDKLKLNKEKGQEIDTCPTITENEDFNLCIVDDKKKKESTCPIAEIAKLYLEILPEHPRIKGISAKRKRDFERVWKADKERQSLEWWEGYFRTVSESDWMTGKKTGKDGNTWIAGIDWLIKEENLLKVIEGNYKNHAPQKSVYETAAEKDPDEIIKSFLNRGRQAPITIDAREIIQEPRELRG